MKILVTGGCGFIGIHLIKKLLYLNYKVINIDCLTYAANKNHKKIIGNSTNYIFYKVNICNKKKINNIFKSEKPDLILHLAAESHVDNSIVEPNNFILTNIIGTYNLLNASFDIYKSKSKKDKKKFRFIHISTDEVYGSSKLKNSFNENSPYMPNSPYSASKASSDHLVRAWNKTFDLPTIITNASNNFGPFQNDEKFIPKIIISLIKNQKVPIYGMGKNQRDWIFVNDHVDALTNLIKNSKPGSKYNISSGKKTTNINLYKKIFKIVKKKIKLSKNNSFLDNCKFVKDRPGHDFIYSINSTKIKKDYKWIAKIELIDGLEKTIDWYIKKYKK